jgi:hypothetical protein
LASLEQQVIESCKNIKKEDISRVANITPGMTTIDEAKDMVAKLKEKGFKQEEIERLQKELEDVREEVEKANSSAAPEVKEESKDLDVALKEQGFPQEQIEEIKTAVQPPVAENIEIIIDLDQLENEEPKVETFGTVYSAPLPPNAEVKVSSNKASFKDGHLVITDADTDTIISNIEQMWKKEEDKKE